MPSANTSQPCCNTPENTSITSGRKTSPSFHLSKTGLEGVLRKQSTSKHLTHPSTLTQDATHFPHTLTPYSAMSSQFHLHQHLMIQKQKTSSTLHHDAKDDPEKKSQYQRSSLPHLSLHSCRSHPPNNRICSRSSSPVLSQGPNPSSQTLKAKEPDNLNIF